MVYLCPFSGTKASIKPEPEEILSVPRELQIAGLHNLPSAESSIYPQSVFKVGISKQDDSQLRERFIYRMDDTSNFIKINLPAEKNRIN